MSFKIAINGYGRIGQSVLRALYSSPYRSKFSIVAVNELADIQTLTYLTRYDTTHGRFPYPLTHDKNILFIGNDKIRVLNESKASHLPWKELDIDLLLECSGSFTDRETAEHHLRSGVKRLLFSQPASLDVDATIVYGFNEHLLKPDHTVVSNASCTTNCIVPVLHILDKELGIKNGVTTTIHSAMNDQPVIDSYHHTNLRLTRSALQSIIPVDTDLAKGIDRLMPRLAGRFDCLHLRVPPIHVTLISCSINVEKSTTIGQVNKLIKNAACGTLNGLLGYTEEPHASVDFNTDARSSIVDGSQTKVCSHKLVKMLCWFDNEWGYANRMLDVAHNWLSL